MFWAIRQELKRVVLYAYSEKIHETIKKQNKTKQKKNRDGVFLSFFGKVVGLQHQNLLKWNPKMGVFLDITEIIFW